MTLTPAAELMNQPLTGMASSSTSSAQCAIGASTACQRTIVPGKGGGGWRQRHSRRPTVSTSTARPTHLCQL